MWGTGFHSLGNLEAGATVIAKVNLGMGQYFAAVLRWVDKTYLSSLVIDTLYDQAEGWNIAVACFYFDFATGKVRTPASTLGALLKQVVDRLDKIPGEIIPAFGRQRKDIGGRRLRLPQIVKMLETVMSSQRTFICIDALDECIDALDECIDALDECIDALDECIDALDECIDALDKCIDALDECIDALDECIDALDECIDALDECIDALDECGPGHRA